MKNKILYAITPIIIAILLLNWIAYLLGVLPVYYISASFQLTISGILLGIILKWNDLFQVIKRGISVNYYLLGLTLFIVLLCIPEWNILIGLEKKGIIEWLIGPFRRVYTRVVFGIIIGILLVDSFKGKDTGSASSEVFRG